MFKWSVAQKIKRFQCITDHHQQWWMFFWRHKNCSLTEVWHQYWNIMHHSAVLGVKEIGLLYNAQPNKHEQLKSKHVLIERNTKMHWLCYCEQLKPVWVTLKDDIARKMQWNPYLRDLHLRQIFHGSSQSFILHRTVWFLCMFWIPFECWRKFFYSCMATCTCSK